MRFIFLVVFSVVVFGCSVTAPHTFSISQTYQLDVVPIGFSLEEHPDGLVQIVLGEEMIECGDVTFVTLQLIAPTLSALHDAEGQIRRAFPNAVLTREED